jgi:hypothetical protein
MVTYLTSTSVVGLTQSLAACSLAFLQNAITILAFGQVLYYLNSSPLCNVFFCAIFVSTELNSVIILSPLKQSSGHIYHLL